MNQEKNLNNVDETLTTFKCKRVDIQLSFFVKKKTIVQTKFYKVKFEIQKKRRFVNMRNAKCKFFYSKIFVSHVIKSIKFIFLIVVLLR